MGKFIKHFLIYLLNTSDRIFIKLFGKKPLHHWKFAHGTEASHFCNSLFDPNRELNYLEIGVFHGFTFEAVRASNKIAVDPNPRYFAVPSRNITTINSDSDTFFSEYKESSFDLIYLDGLHHFRQTWRDIYNASRVVSSHGVIMIDDTVPGDKFSALIPQSRAISTRKLATGSDSKVWHGDVYKINLLLSKLPKNFTFMTVLFPKNPRAILFCSDGNWDSFPLVTEDELVSLESVNVDSVFSFDPKPIIPKWFNPVTPDTALQIIKSSWSLEQ